MLLPGCAHYQRAIDVSEQAALLADCVDVFAAAPPLQPIAPWGKPLSVRMTNAGALGWVTDATGYRYQATHPETAAPWPPIPRRLRALWRRFVGVEGPVPDCCLINYFDPGARLGLHRDDTEAETRWPVLSLSIGDAATFRLGGLKRRDVTRSITLESGDVFVLSGAGRLAYHGVDRIKRRPGNPLETASALAPWLPIGPGRLSFTLRVAGALRGDSGRGG